MKDGSRLRWIACFGAVACAVSVVAACSGPSEDGAPSAEDVALEDVVVMSQPITTGSDIVIREDGEDAGPISVKGGLEADGGVEATGPASLVVVTNVEIGDYLADLNGRTVYLFTNDRPFDSTCDGVCRQNWPPVLTAGMPTAGDGVDQGLVGTMLREDGDDQVTYNGWPLYYLVDDTEPGSTYGQGVNGLWFVVSPAGDALGP